MADIEKVERRIEDNLNTKDSFLDLSECELTGNEETLKKLKDAKHLEDLHLEHNQILDISFLEELTKLKWLYLSTNENSDISVLKKLKQLQYLDLNENKVSDISVLKELKQLKYISLRDNQISDISVLKELKQLEHLDLKDNQISDISFLKELKQLRYIDLSENKISTFPLNFINQSSQLETLHIDNNPIENIPRHIFNNYWNVLKEVKKYLLIDKEKLDKEKSFLLKFIEETEYSTFFNETKKIGKRNAELIRLEKKFMHDGGGFEFAEQLKVWVLHNFE